MKFLVFTSDQLYVTTSKWGDGMGLMLLIFPILSWKRISGYVRFAWFTLGAILEIALIKVNILQELA